MLQGIKGLRGAGFTLIELMIVVAIIGILSSIATPAFLKYVRRSRTVEAMNNIRKIYDGEIAYFDVDHVSRTGIRASAQFVSAAPQPSDVPSGQKTTGNWDDAGWVELKFHMDGPALYRYSAIASGFRLDASFTARAEGDLDGDDLTSVFERIGAIDSSTGEAIGGSGVYTAFELE